MTKQTAMQQLVALKLEQMCLKYPNVPNRLMAVPKYNDKTANGLTRCVIDYIIMNGGMAERINSTGRMINDTFQYTDAIGFRRTMGSVKWIPGTGTKGTSDIHAVIQGRFIAIEIKIKDKQLETQKIYEKKINNAGGIYIIVHSLQEFVDWYEQFIKTL